MSESYKFPCTVHLKPCCEVPSAKVACNSIFVLRSAWLFVPQHCAYPLHSEIWIWETHGFLRKWRCLQPYFSSQELVWSRSWSSNLRLELGVKLGLPQVNTGVQGEISAELKVVGIRDLSDRAASKADKWSSSCFGIMSKVHIMILAQMGLSGGQGLRFRDQHVMSS